MLLCALFSWSAVTITTPALCRTSAHTAAAGRALLGLFEGTTFPCIFAILSPIVPSESRGNMLARLNIAATLGTIAAFAACPILVETAGWPSMFYLFGFAGIVVCSLWLQLDGLQASVDTVSEEAAASQKAVGSDTTRTAFRYLSLPAVCAICFSHACNNFGDAMVFSWLPTLMSSKYSVTGYQLSLSSIPYVARMGGATLGGRWSDRLVRRQGSTTTAARCRVVTVGFGLAAIALGLVGSVHDAGPAFLLFSIERFTTAAGSVGGYEAAKLDIATGADAALLQALANSIGAVASLLGTNVIPMIVAAGGGWDDALRCAAILYCCSALSYARWGDSSVSVASHVLTKS